MEPGCVLELRFDEGPTSQWFCSCGWYGEKEPFTSMVAVRAQVDQVKLHEAGLRMVSDAHKYRPKLDFLDVIRDIARGA